MSKRFGALKSNDNPFKQGNPKRKRANKSNDDKPKSGIFRTDKQPHSYAKRCMHDQALSEANLGTNIERKVDTVKDNLLLDDDAFPELEKANVGHGVNKVSTKLCFGKALSNKQSSSCKLSLRDSNTIARSSVNLRSTEKSKLSLKITNLIINKMEEQERKAHYLQWLNNWQKDREERMNNGETFYEPYSLDDLDDGSDDSDIDDYEMEETEYWNAGRGKQGKSYEN